MKLVDFIRKKHANIRFAFIYRHRMSRRQSDE